MSGFFLMDNFSAVEKIIDLQSSEHTRWRLHDTFSKIKASGVSYIASFEAWPFILIFIWLFYRRIYWAGFVFLISGYFITVFTTFNMSVDTRLLNSDLPKDSDLYALLSTYHMMVPTLNSLIIILFNVLCFWVACYANSFVIARFSRLAKKYSFGESNEISPKLLKKAKGSIGMAILSLVLMFLFVFLGAMTAFILSYMLN